MALLGMERDSELRHVMNYRNALAHQVEAEIMVGSRPWTCKAYWPAPSALAGVV